MRERRVETQQCNLLYDACLGTEYTCILCVCVCIHADVCMPRHTCTRDGQMKMFGNSECIFIHLCVSVCVCTGVCMP